MLKKLLNETQAMNLKKIPEQCVYQEKLSFGIVLVATF